MSDSKIKIKDLATELKMDAKELLQELQSMGFNVKSAQGSIPMEEVSGVRYRVAENRQRKAGRKDDQPTVIVRRRRVKDEAPAAEQPVAGTRAEAAPEKAPDPAAPVETPAARVISVPEPEKAPGGKPEPVKVEPKAEKTPEPVAPVETPAVRVVAAPEAEKAPEAKPEPVKNETKADPRTEAKREARVEKATPRTARVVAPAGARVISRPDATPTARVIRPAQADAPVTGTENKPGAKPEKTPEAKPEVRKSAVLAAINAKEAAENGAAEKPAKPRAGRPDASAMPEGSSAPTLPQREAHENRDDRPAEATPTRARVVAPAPQVRVISRPQPGAAPARDSRDGGRDRDGGREGRDRDGRDNRSGRPGGNRPGLGNRPGFGDRPRGGTPRPAGGGYSAPAPAAPLDSRDGQSKKKRNKGRRTVDFQQGDFGRHQDDDDAPRLNRSPRGRRKPGKPAAVQATQPLKAAKRKIRVTEAIRVADMAHQMGLKANEIIKVLFGLGVMATINQSLDIDTATLVAAEFDYEVEKAGFSEEDYLLPQQEDKPEDLKPRPPVVTIMGHVDHGKTSLLDAIRKSNVTSGEAGGITQHIGAYHVKTKRGEIVFLDTPGHEAFTAMRARGAQVTDLVILVVAADDGVMEQTREAVNHSRAAGVPIMVAVNKMDKPGADPDRVLRELSEMGLQPEDWGGDTIVAKVSAKTRQGLDDLLELVALQSEIMDLKANPNKPAHGRIVEAKLDKGRGPVATVLIQEGTLHQGDNFVCGQFSGRVRALMNDQGKKVKEAGPSIPVEVQGFEGVPEAGEEFFAVADEKLARRIAEMRATKQRERDLSSESKVTLETFLSRRASDQETLTLNLVLKADVQGSLEAITEALNKQSTEKVRINVVHGGTGAISESDIMLASASQAIIIGFNVRPTSRIKDIAERENVDIRFYDIIYKLVDDIKSAMAGLLAPVQREVYLGQAEVRNTFSVPKVGIIAGSYVADGKIARNAGVRLLRDGVVVYTGKISSLKRFKDDAREVVKGNECGVGLENFNDVKIGDIIEVFETVEEAATL